MMNSSKSRKLASVLWDHFRPAIDGGNQIYFCINRELIRSICSEHLEGEAVEGFFSHVRQYFEVVNGRCQIKEEVFAKENGFSLLILVIAFQILVVEDMVEEESISEDAYFPRLRRRISPELPEESLLPFVAEEFMRIWNEFREEVIRSGAKETSITFYGGLGANKYRSYPMSQALLSVNDLIKLYRKIAPRISTHNIGEEALLRLAKEHRYSLSKRSRRVMAIGWLWPRIASQIRSFFANFSEESASYFESKTNEAGVELRIYANTDLFDSSYEIVGVNKATGDVENSRLVQNIVQNLIENKSYIVFTLTPGNDFWEVSRTAVDVRVGDSLICLLGSSERQTVSAAINNFWPNESSKLRDIELNCAVIGSIFTITKPSHLSCAVKNGLLTDMVKRNDVQWTGGICVDSRSNKFLIGYPPTGVVVNGIDLLEKSMVKIGDSERQLGEVLLELKNLKAEHILDIEFGNNLSLPISFFASREFEGGSGYGFKIEDRVLGSFPESLGKHPSSVSGYRFNGTRNYVHLNKSHVYLLLKLDLQEWEDLDLQELDWVLRSVDEMKIAAPIKRAAKSVVMAHSKAPSKIKQILKIGA